MDESEMSVAERVIRRYYRYEEVISASEIVREFIAERGLVLYGGQAIDYSLRMHGEQIYEDYAIPDYDFYSVQNVLDAYEIFRILGEKGYAPIRVLPAIHPLTMKVGVSLDFVADVGYAKPTTFAMYEQTALRWEGMLLRHPFLHYVDFHRAFAFPYEGMPGRQTILNRWKKDWERNLISMKYYRIGDLLEFLVKLKYEAIAATLFSSIMPPNPSSDRLGGNWLRVDKSLVSTGWLAFYYYMGRLDLIRERDGELELLCAANVMPCYLLNHEDWENRKLKSKKFDLKIYRWHLGDGVQYCFTNHEVAIQNVQIHGLAVCLTSVNYVILYAYTLMMHYYEIKLTASTNTAYMGMYFALLGRVEEWYPKLDVAAENENITERHLLPSIETFGEEILDSVAEYIKSKEKPDIRPTPFYYQKGEERTYLQDMPESFEYDPIYEL